MTRVPGAPQPEHDDLFHWRPASDGTWGTETGPQLSHWRPCDSSQLARASGRFSPQPGQFHVYTEGNSEPTRTPKQENHFTGKTEVFHRTFVYQAFLGIYYGCPGHPGLPATHPANYLFGFYCVIVFIFMFSHPEELLTPWYGF